jgi:hypothetical protein
MAENIISKDGTRSKTRQRKLQPTRKTLDDGSRVVEIPLGRRGLLAIIDESDFEAVRLRPWWAIPKSNGFYVISVKPGWIFDLPETRFGCVLIDHAAEIRVRDALRVKDIADFVVIHDTQNDDYGMKAVWPHYKFRVDDRRYRPHTTCVSNVRKLEVDW